MISNLNRRWRALRGSIRSLAGRARIFSPSFELAAGAARRAERAWRLDEAAALWSAVRDRYPGQADAHIGYASVLARLNRHEEALAALAVATERLPRSLWLEVSRVRITHAFSRFGDALRLSRDIVAAFPDDPHGPELLGKCLSSLLRYAEADAVLVEARARFPQSLGLAIEYTASAEMRGDYAEALRRSQAMMGDFPNQPLSHAILGATLKRLKRYDDADRVLAAGMARFPGNSNMAVNFALVADDRGDWQEALRRWSAADSRYPGDPRIRTGLLESRSRADLARIDEAPDAAPANPPPPPVAAGQRPDLQRNALFIRFESMGENCEFGFVQRHFGAEPLGLLRWAGIGFEKLIVGLDSHFEGVGGTERTRLAVNPTNLEYVVHDTYFDLNMHTFMLRDEATEATTYKKMCRRLLYLREKLLDDLASAEKIFVFQTRDDLPDDDLRRLHRAIRRHGPGRVLAVRRATGERRPGEVVLLAEGLAAGFIDRVGLHDNHWNVSFDCWLQLCCGALALLEQEVVHA